MRWESALPVRQALERRQVQVEKLTPEQAEQFFEQAPSEYVVVLGGVPIAETIGTTLEEVKASTYLKTGDKQRIMAQDVHKPRLGEPGRGTSSRLVLFLSAGNSHRAPPQVRGILYRSWPV